MLVTVLISSLLAVLSGLGIGGGSLLMLWLTIICKLDPLTAKQINLLFFLPTAAISCIVNVRNKRIVLSTVLPAAVAGCFSAAYFSSISRNWDTITFQKCFGILLCIAAVNELCYHKKER